MNLFCYTRGPVSLLEFLFFLAAGIVLYAICSAARRWGDKSEIEQNLRRQGARLRFLKRCRRLDTWANKNTARYYQIRYHDRNGWEHEAQCMTDNIGGVYYADDTVSGESAVEREAPAAARPVTGENRIADLEAENRRLKAELERSRLR